MMRFKQTDIVLVWFPNSDLSSVKKRPAIVLQADNLNTGLNQLIIGMITSNSNRKNHKSRIFIKLESKIGNKTGLLTDSVIMTDNIATIRTEEIYKKIGEFTDTVSLENCLKNTFNIGDD